MRRTYKESEKVLVLDSAITPQPSTSLTAMEMMAQLRTSVWVRRLWTFHEAYLAKELHYQFADIPMTLSEIRNKFHCEGGTGFQSHLSQYDEQHEPSKSKPQTSDSYLQKLSDEVKTGIEVANLIWMEACWFMRRVEVMGKFGPEEDHTCLRNIIHPLRWRTTSRMKDETICLSGCLGRTVEDLDEVDSQSERMKLFLGSMQSVPAGLVFVDRPRIEEDGFRWMPLSLLSGGIESTLPDVTGVGDPIGYPTPTGLTVSLPGVLVQDIHVYNTRFRGGFEHEVVYVRLDQVPYYIFGLNTKSIKWRDYDGLDLAIIMCGKTDPGGTWAILVSVQERSEDVIRCKFLVCAMISGNPEAHCVLEDTKFTTTSSLGQNQGWCVG
ncbi:MAG: hypothetical protein Q9186_005201 [Xanthomendoza sp. 1 TL-2023]